MGGDVVITNKRLCAGTLTDASATLYTVPADTMTIVKALTVCNITASPVTVTLKLDGIEIFSAYPIAANGMASFPNIDQIIESTELIEGLASVVDSVRFYISGKEVTA